MQRDAVEAVTLMFEAFARRDLEATLSQLDPDVVLTVTATAALAGRTGPYRGHEGVRQYFEDVDAVWSELELEPSDFRAVADSVVIFGRVRGVRAPIEGPPKGGEGASRPDVPVPLLGVPEPGEAIELNVIWTWKLEQGKIISGNVHLSV